MHYFLTQWHNRTLITTKTRNTMLNESMGPLSFTRENVSLSLMRLPLWVVPLFLILRATESLINTWKREVFVKKYSQFINNILSCVVLWLLDTTQRLRSTSKTTVIKTVSMTQMISTSRWIRSDTIACRLVVDGLECRADNIHFCLLNFMSRKLIGNVQNKLTRRTCPARTSAAPLLKNADRQIQMNSQKYRRSCNVTGRNSGISTTITLDPLLSDLKMSAPHNEGKINAEAEAASFRNKTRLIVLAAGRIGDGNALQVIRPFLFR